MKAVAVYPTQHRLAVVADQPEPPLTSASAVRLRILEVGLCGTDKEIAHFDYGEPPPGNERLVLGHESLGEVLEVGSDVRDLSPGDLVVPTVRRPCGRPECRACALGRSDYCFTGEFLERGIKGLDGFMTEVVVEEERYLHKVPRSLRDVAVLTEPLTIAQKALRQIFDVQDRLPWGCSPPREISSASCGEERPNVTCRRALVLGAGPIGLLSAMTLLDAGFDTTVYSRSGGLEERVEIVERLGGRFVVAEEVAPENLGDAVGQVDVVLEAVGASQLAFDALALLGPNAIFVFTGVPGRRGKNVVDTDTIMRNTVLKNQAIIGTVNAGPEDFRGAIASLSRYRERWPGQLERLITGRFPPDHAPDLLTGKGPRGIKNVVSFAPPEGFPGHAVPD